MLEVMWPLCSEDLWDSQHPSLNMHKRRWWRFLIYCSWWLYRHTISISRPYISRLYIWTQWKSTHHFHPAQALRIYLQRTVLSTWRDCTRDLELSDAIPLRTIKVSLFAATHSFCFQVYAQYFHWNYFSLKVFNAWQWTWFEGKEEGHEWKDKHTPSCTYKYYITAFRLAYFWLAFCLQLYAINIPNFLWKLVLWF